MLVGFPPFFLKLLYLWNFFEHQSTHLSNQTQVTLPVASTLVSIATVDGKADGRSEIVGVNGDSMVGLMGFLITGYLQLPIGFLQDGTEVEE